MAHASSPAAPHPAPPSSHLLAPLVSLALSPSHPHPRSKRTHALADSHSIPRTRTTPPDPARAAANPWHSTPVPPGALMLIGQPNPQRQPGHPQTKVWTAPPGRVGSLERWRLWWGAGVTPVSMLEWWEVLLFNTVLLLVLSLLYFGLAHLPAHLSIIASRARYYLSGTEEL